jgi:diguanylate cyclase (GGDEF)-like protein
MNPTATDISPMVWLVAAQFLLYAVGWGLFSLLLPERRAPVVHWGLFMLFTGLGMLLASHRQEPRTWLPYVGANLLFCAGYVSLRRGLEVFMDMKPRDLEHLLLYACAALAFFLLGEDAANGAARVMLAYGFGAWVLARSRMTVLPRMAAEFGKRLSWVMSFPALLLIVMFSYRVVQQAVNTDVLLEMHRQSASNQRFLAGYLFGAALFNFSFMGLLTSRMVGRLREQTQRDPLTNLLNRRALEGELQIEWQRLRQGGAGFAVLALDLDHFKDVNDRYGHPAGDAVLALAAQRLRAAVRDVDTVARTGGEEFVVLLPQSTTESALAAAQRLRQGMVDALFQVPGGSVAVTVSVGVALPLPEDTGAQQVLQRADRALYRAKEQGRNRVVLAQG